MAGHGSRGAVIGAILALALAARLLAGGWWQERLPAGQRLGFGDSESYWFLAQTIARGEPYQYGSPDARIFRTPGYPAVLAVLFYVLGDTDPPVLAARALSALCGTVAVAATMALAWQMFGAQAGIVAGLLAALHPEVLALGTFVLSEAPFHPLMVLNILCLRAAWLAAPIRSVAAPPGRSASGKCLRWAAAAGICAGLATLMRPSWLLFTPYALGLSLFTSGGRRRFVRLAPPMVLGLIFVMAPWWWRNFEVTGHFVPTTLQVGASLYDGWRPDATGGSDMRFVPQFEAEQRAADAASAGPLVGTFEERLDRRQRDAALAWAQAHPRRIAELAGLKLWRMWSPVPNAAEMQGLGLRIVTAAGLVPLLVLAAWQTARRLRAGHCDALLWLPALYLTHLHVIFVSSLRYRQPALLPLLALAAGFVGEWWRRSQSPGGAA